MQLKIFSMDFKKKTDKNATKNYFYAIEQEDCKNSN